MAAEFRRLKTFFLIFWGIRFGVSNALPNVLQFSITYRDFLPSDCFFTGNSSLEQLVLNAWGDSGTPDKNDKTDCSRILGNEIWKVYLNSGKIFGHPDFDANKALVIPRVCTSGLNGTNFPVSSCAFSLGSSFSIVSDTLKVSSNGLPKMQYCKNTSEEDRCGFASQDASRKDQSQTQKKYFDTWYEDDLRYNKRVGQKLQLYPVAGKTGTYIFDSSAHSDSPEFVDKDLTRFAPLEHLVSFNNLSLFTNPLDLPTWPAKIADTRSFSFTTELHTTFQYNASAEMLFEFSGDDDFWAFINGKLVIDLGGLHEARTGSVNLNDKFNGKFDVAKYLGLVDGGIYTLDIFHADRQFSGSNFKITTTIFPACNAIQLGTTVLSTTHISANDFATHFFAQGVSFDADSKIITLQNPDETFSSGKLFSTAAQNLFPGFVAKFEVSISGFCQGFAFVVQNSAIDDLPSMSGDSLGFYGIRKSFAVAFRLSERDQMISVHYPESSSLENNASTATMHTHDVIARNLRRSEYFPVEIVYYGNNQNVLEVFVNNSLYLRESSFDIISILNGSGGYLGFTTSSADIAADISIKNFVLNVVSIEPDVSELENLDFTKPFTVIADGNQKSPGISFTTFDLCGNRLLTGTLSYMVDAKFIKLSRTGTDSKRDLTADELKSRAVVDAVVIDNHNGSYTMALQTTEVGNFSLVIAFGDGCRVGYDEDELYPYLVTNQVSLSSCYFKVVNEGKAVVTSMAPEKPDSPAFSLFPDYMSPSAIMATVAAAGGICCLGIATFFVFLGFFRKWKVEKKFVQPGIKFRLENSTVFLKEDEYYNTSKKLQETQEEILYLRSKSLDNPSRNEIRRLTEENELFKLNIRELTREIEEASQEDDDYEYVEDSDFYVNRTMRREKIDFDSIDQP